MSIVNRRKGSSLLIGGYAVKKMRVARFD